MTEKIKIINMARRMRNNVLEVVLTSIGIAGIILGGSFIYQPIRTQFQFPASNTAKLPGYVVGIADRLLELKDSPKVIVQDPIGVYIRQYTGEIDTLYGRDLEGYILGPSLTAETVNSILKDSESDLNIVNQIMLDDEFDYIVTKDREADCFTLIDTVAGFDIFKAIGIPTVIKEHDENGRVIASTYVDEKGNPFVGKKGYSTIKRKYDEYGNIIFEYYTDTDGKGILYGNNYAGFERVYDRHGHILMERLLGVDGEEIVSNLGYAMVMREYSGDKLIKESYYDENENLINTINGYAQIEYKYDGTGNLISETLLNSDGHLVTGASGYAIRKCKYSHGKKIYEEYYGADEKLLPQLAGHVAIKQEWDGDNLLSRTYLDSNGKPINRIDGYSKAIWMPDDTGTRMISFYDAKGTAVNISGLNLTKDVMTGSDGWSEWMYPTYNIANSCLSIGELNLGEKEVGDTYSCSVEIEFEDVTATPGEYFRMWTQGSQDGDWLADNVWNAKLVNLYEALNGVHIFTSTVVISDDMMSINKFDLGFRCDYWSGGAFRVRNVMIEKGNLSDGWKPGI